MLLHAFLAQAGAGTVLATAGGEPRDVALLTLPWAWASSRSRTRQRSRLRSTAWPPLRPGRWPGPRRAARPLRALRPALARIADRTDPVALQRMFASAMLDGEPVASGVYYVDDRLHPIPGPSRSRKAGTTSAAGRRRAARRPTSPRTKTGGGVLRHRGALRLSVTLPKALAELKKAARRGDHGRLRPRRRLPAGLRRCRDGCTGSPTGAPRAHPAGHCTVITAVTFAGRTRQLHLARRRCSSRTTAPSRQITLFEHGQAACKS